MKQWIRDEIDMYEYHLNRDIQFKNLTHNQKEYKLNNFIQEMLSSNKKEQELGTLLKYRLGIDYLDIIYQI